jgi:hypothetical protein
MSRFAELGTIKDTIMKKLVEDECIVRCLISNESNFETASTPVGYDPNDLLYTQIFPYRFIPDITIEPSTFITMKFSYKPSGTTFKYGSIYFYVITNRSIVQTDYGMLRYDYLVNRLDVIFNKNNELGIGAMPFSDMDEFIIDKEGKWLGSYIAYKNIDFQ